MATDRNGQTIVDGTDYVVVGTARAIGTTETLLLSGSDGQHAVRCSNAALASVDSFTRITQTNTVSGTSVSTGVTSLPLSIGGGAALALDAVGIPVAEAMTTGPVCTSWLSDNAPGDWTLRLHKRNSSSSFTEVATFTVTTA